MLKALIPVRSGSTRVKNKNLKPFAGSNILTVKIQQLKRIKGLDGIAVNSNSDEMLDIARSLGVEAIKRDEYYATNNVSINEVYKNMAENCSCDDILFSNATSPLIKDETIEKCIKKYYSLEGIYDSLATVNEVKEFMWLNGKPINYDLNNKPRSQDLPDIVAVNHAIGILPRKIMIEKRDMMGYKPYLYKIDLVEAVDIDNEIDFDFAEFVYKRNLNAKI